MNIPGSALHKGDVVEVAVDRIVRTGAGAGMRHEREVRVPCTAPGDVARVRVRRRRRGGAEAELVELVRPAPERVQPRCSVFGRCGGCSWQHLPYEQQLRVKEGFVRAALSAHLPPERLEAIVPSPAPWAYRNKMEFTFGRDDADRLICGLHEPGIWWQALPVDKCHIVPEEANALLRAAVAFGRDRRLDAWDPRTHRGLLRHLVFRWSASQRTMLVQLFTGDDGLPDFDAFVRCLREACPAAAGVHWYVNPGKADAVQYAEPAGRWGAEYIEERVDDLVFRISPESFYQSNPAAAVLLYRLVRDYLELERDHVLLDAFCGAGTIGQYCARSCKQVIGIELVEAAVADARAGSARNGIDNIAFHAGDVRRAVKGLLAEQGVRFDRIVLDPPRGGVERRALKALARAEVPLLVYVSCNLTALESDLAFLAEFSYRTSRARPVDLFPQTPHVETVVQVTRD